MKIQPLIVLICLTLGIAGVASAASIGGVSTFSDSTQPRGATPAMNPEGQVLSPLEEGIWSPHYRVSFGFLADCTDPAICTEYLPECPDDGSLPPFRCIPGCGDFGTRCGIMPDGTIVAWSDEEKEMFEDFESWSGMLMGNSMRDPYMIAMLSVVNKYFIKLLNATPGDPTDPNSPLGALLVGFGLDQEGIGRKDDLAKLTNEDLLPIAADLCLRCHTPPGWLEGRSEPQTTVSPFLTGQFWGAEFLSNPGCKEAPCEVVGGELAVNPWGESESEVDGMQCGFCHRVYDNFKRVSNFDGSEMPNGNGGYFMERTSKMGFSVDSVMAMENFEFTESPEFCGTCHDVTNPVFETRTEVMADGKNLAAGQFHPIERTYTEWFWSAYGPNDADTASDRSCQECHKPMRFLGPQTWLLEGYQTLWGAVDDRWTKEPYNYLGHAYLGKPSRNTFYTDAVARNRLFMTDMAVDEHVVGAPPIAPPATLELTTSQGDGQIGLTVKVTNNTGHKLPTGYPEGRQMWLHVTAVDGKGTVIYENGFLDADGKLVRDISTKVYEIVSVAEGYEDYLDEEGINILDANVDGVVDHHEKEFHFILGNKIEKDNRIPPKGFNKAAYIADGAFIVPRDPGDTDYPDGQNWDETNYSIPLPRKVVGPITISVTLNYQSFNQEFTQFLYEQDKEYTQKYGGRARNIPAGPFDTKKFRTWGTVAKEIWVQGGNGLPVQMAIASEIVTLP